jgi:hypothetical protein
MQKIIYKVNGGKIQNIVHCEIIQESDKEIKVLINDELERTIEKKKIVQILPIDL